jgi:hypothetical protein
MYMSLKEIRDELNIELRNDADHPRYSTEEVDLAIRRAVGKLERYFWWEDILEDDQVYITNDYTYVFDYPVRDIIKIEYGQDYRNNVRIEDWTEENNPRTLQTTIQISKVQEVGAGFRIHYENHPILPPSDIQVMNNQDADGLTLRFTGGVEGKKWPSQGFAKIGSEVVYYSRPSVISSDRIEYTVERGMFDTYAEEHNIGDVVSYVLICDKPVFFEGVKDLAIGYLNRMRIIDSTSADVGGNVTIMRQILDDFDGWLRAHRMRSKRPNRTYTRRTTPMRRWMRRR